MMVPGTRAANIMYQPYYFTTLLLKNYLLLNYLSVLRLMRQPMAATSSVISGHSMLKKQ